MMRRRRNQYFMCACVFLYIYYFFGVSDYMFAKSYNENFDYPLDMDIRPIVKDVISGKKPKVSPINVYPYRFLTNYGKCSMLKKLDLVIIVKSAMEHFDRRAAIRKTYGHENYKRSERIIKTLFFLGIESPKSNLQEKIDIEISAYKDIIQMNFIDNYYNNTIKTMMSFRWLFEHCSDADYYLFTDDDMYISTRNLLEYVEQKSSIDLNGSNMTWHKEDTILFAGFVFESTPQRFRSSKWRVSLEEYAWNRWPPYVTAGAYVVSNRAMKMLYVGSLFVKHFRFDDIYLGIVAKKVGINPTHCSGFYFYKKHYSDDGVGFLDVIASHGYGKPEELIRVWRQQNLL